MSAIQARVWTHATLWIAFTYRSLEWETATMTVDIFTNSMNEIKRKVQSRYSFTYCIVDGRIQSPKDKPTFYKQFIFTPFQHHSWSHLT